MEFCDELYIDMQPTRPILRTILRWTLIAIYLFVGTAHIRDPGTFLPIMPGWVPFPRQVILVTGIWEIAGALMMMTPRLRRVAGWMLATYAVAVYPANIKHALDGISIGGTQLGWEYHGPRLLFQPVFVWWALFAGNIVDWPLRRKAWAMDTNLHSR
ncbi:DoxX family protein [Pacificimonas sp. ICDLI1SI03]